MRLLVLLLLGSVLATITGPLERNGLKHVVMPKLPLIELIRLSRLSKDFHSEYEKILDTKFLTTVNGKNMFDLGVLYLEYKQLDEDDSGIGLIEFIMSVIERYRVEGNLGFWALASLEYLEYAFFSTEDELKEGLVWSPEFASFFNELFRTKRFKAAISPDVGMIIRSDIEALSTHLAQMSVQELEYLLLTAPKTPAKVWIILVHKLGNVAPKYLTLLKNNPTMLERCYRKDITIMDSASFCLIARLVNDANRLVCMRLLNHTTVEHYDRSWYYYMIIMRVTYTVIRYCFKQRPKTLGAEFINRAVLAVAYSGFEHKMYQYLRYGPEKAIKPYAEGKQVALKNITARDALEACLMLNASDEACFQVMRVPGFQHDTQLLVLSLIKGRSVSFIERLMASDRNGAYQMIYFWIPFPGDRCYYFTLKTTVDIALLIYKNIDEPEQFLAYSCTKMLGEDWIRMVHIGVEHKFLSEAALVNIAATVSVENIPKLFVLILPYCITHGFNMNLEPYHDIVRGEIKCQLTSIVKEQPYLTLYSWWRSLTGTYEPSSLLALTCSIIRSQRPF